MSSLGFGAKRRVVVPRLLAALAFAVALVAPDAASLAAADGAPVQIGEVSTTVGHEEVVPLMKSTLAVEVAKVTPPPGRRFIVSASLNKLEAKKSGAKVTTSCLISVALRDAKDGNLIGTLQGTSAVIGSSMAGSDAVEAAVRGATKSLPEAMGH